MTVTLLTSQSAPTTTDADALVTGVFQGQTGPVLTRTPDEIDLMAALTALGATGKAEENGDRWLMVGYGLQAAGFCT